MGPAKVQPPPDSLLDRDARFPGTEEERYAVREQLERLLASSVFRRSRGCSKLLAYVVNRTLDGDAEHLKERNLGVEVFGRALDYDTASDHVVRSTAGEVRKRLAQYYTQPGRTGELRIDVPTGSYVPRFLAAHEIDHIDLAPVSVAARNGHIQSVLERARSHLAAISLIVAGAAALLTLAVAATVEHSSGGTLDSFWRPVLQSPSPILLCIGDWNQVVQSGRDGPKGPADDNAAPPSSPTAFGGSEKVYLNDAITLARITGWLQQNRKPFRISAHSNVTFTELQSSPAVLIGLRSNYWTTGLADRLRFTVGWGAKPHTLVMQDKRNPARSDWSVDLTTPFSQITSDYALVVRALDPRTGQMVIVAGGMTHLGSLAAGEFLTDPVQMKKLDAYAPRGWEGKNLEVVLSTEVIKGSAGPPKIVAAEFW